MKIVVLDGSPKEKSDTLKLTDAFLMGFNKEQPSKVITHKIINEHILPCIGCFSCYKNEQTCIIEDDMTTILVHLKEADLVIWSFPLYYYGLPSHLKAVLDRTLPLTKKEITETNGKYYHMRLDSLNKAKTIMICGSGFPYFKDNFTAVISQFQNAFNDLTTITVAQTPMLNVQEANVVTAFLLEKFKAAGIEYAKNQFLSKETIDKLQKPMFPGDLYLKMANHH